MNGRRPEEDVPSIDVPVNRPIDLSIVICSRNRAKSLPDTLRSLSSLRSRYEYEIIVADNASTGETADVIRRAGDGGRRLRYIFVGRGGVGAAREAGWRAAGGRIIAFTDDDCYPEPSYADAVVDAFERRLEAGNIGGRILLHGPADLKVTIDERDAPIRMEP